MVDLKLHVLYINLGDRTREGQNIFCPICGTQNFFRVFQCDSVVNYLSARARRNWDTQIYFLPEDTDDCKTRTQLVRARVAQPELGAPFRD